jgi:YesN/AraC family two-component response regulator
MINSAGHIHFLDLRHVKGDKFLMEKTQSRIIVADDEAIQRNVLTKIINNIYPTSEVIACSNGKEVYDILQEKQVDVVLTDIRMPIMDGMELIRIISSEFPRTKVILISAYQEFEYAQNAIKYRAFDYLIKPFRVTEVKKVVEKVQLEIQKENEKENSLNNYQALMVEAKKQKKHRFLQDVLAGNIDDIKLEQEEYKPLQDFGTVAVLRWKVECARGVSTRAEGTGAESARAENAQGGLTKLQQNALMDQIAFLFPNMFFVPEANDTNKAIHKAVLLFPRETAVEVSQKLEYSQKLLEQENIFFWAGLSNTKLCLVSSAVEALAQAEEMLAFYFYDPKGGIFSYDKMNTIMEIPTNSTTAFENKLHQAIRSSDIKRMEQIIEDMKRVLSQGTRCYPSKIKHRVSSMIVLILKELDDMISQEQYDYLLNQSYQLYAECDSFDQLFEISKHLLGMAIQDSLRDANQVDAVEACIAYMKAHLDSDLSLQKVAEQVHFHPNYLSVKIKNKVGLTYSAFLLKLRMELACKLLMNTNDKVQEIAFKCGFNDSNYFNRMFRREYQISPEQYRKVHKKW